MRLRRARVNTSVDIGRLSAGLARPGMDTRVWESVAYAQDESYLDPQHGIFVDVILAPTGEELTVRVGAEYAGNGFGLYLGTIHKDDELLVGVPLGDPSEGPVVLRRLWSAADKPPQEAIDHPEEILLVAEKNLNVRLIAKEDGKVYVKGETVTAETDNVRLGAEDATEQVPLGTTWRAKESAMHSTLQTQLGTLSTLLGTAGGSLTTAGPLTLLPPAGAAIAAAGAALTSAVAAVTAMQTAIAQYEAEAAAAQNLLSEVSKTK